MKTSPLKLCAATPLPCRGGAGVGSVYIRLSESYYSAIRKVLAMQAAKLSSDPTPTPPLEGRGVAAHSLHWLRTI